MAIDALPNPDYVVDAESERLTTWPNGSVVYCKDSKVLYCLVTGTFNVAYNYAGGGGPGGNPTFTNVELNLGAIPKYGGSFQITGSGFTINKPVNITQGVGPYTNKGTGTGAIDEAEMDALSILGYVLDANTIQCYWTAAKYNGPVVGNFKFNYFVGG